MATEREKQYARQYYAEHTETVKVGRRRRGNPKQAMHREFIRAQKLGKVCAMCGESDTTKLVFHHSNPATKRMAVSNMVGYSESAILAEIAKCVLWCRPCHMRHHKTGKRK